MKPEFTKPFDFAHAKAGAPYSFDDGESAEIIAWARTGAMSLVSMKGPHQSLALSRVDGTSGGVARLVMLPLGLIDGKPVFVGDAIEMNLAKGWIVVKAMPTWAGTWVDDGKLARWPAPAKVYPVSLMTDTETFLAVSDDIFDLAGRRHGLANAAIRHAIDAGQVVIAAEADQARKDAYKAGIVSGRQQRTVDRDARDLLIARAVRSAACGVIQDVNNHGNLGLLRAVQSMCFATIIATVPK